MDMITIDVTDVPARTGDEVVLLGVQGTAAESSIDVREMAATVGTIPWETLCRVGTRIERIYNSVE
jgi:alanine racemase